MAVPSDLSSETSVKEEALAKNGHPALRIHSGLPYFYFLNGRPALRIHSGLPYFYFLNGRPAGT